MDSFSLSKDRTIGRLHIISTGLESNFYFDDFPSSLKIEIFPISPNHCLYTPLIKLNSFF